jgi:hypothetical protein
VVDVVLRRAERRAAGLHVDRSGRVVALDRTARPSTTRCSTAHHARHLTRARARAREQTCLHSLVHTSRRLSTRPRARILHSLACARAAADTHAQWHRCLALLPCCEILRLAAASAAHIVARVAAEGAAASESVKVSSHGRALGRSRRRCGRESRRRCGRVPAPMWASPGADVGDPVESACRSDGA